MEPLTTLIFRTKNLFLILLMGVSGIMSALGSTAYSPQANSVLWYRQPAKEWLEALPLGNGRLGAMVFGRINEERIQLNENTLWGGERQNTTNPDALQFLPDIRRLLLEGKPLEATELADKHLMGNPKGVKSYQTLGDLTLHFLHQGAAQNYRRELDLNSGIARVAYDIDNTHYTREIFASHPHNVIAIHLTASQKGKLSLRLQLSRPKDANTLSENNKTLVLRGKIAPNGMEFEARLTATTVDGAVTCKDGVLEIAHATEATILLTAATNYGGADPAETCKRTVERRVPYRQLRNRHVADYKKLFQRVSFTLGDQNRSHLPTDKRLAAIKKGEEDLGLIALYFQYGRYLLLSSSRPGGLPANLQGLWNDLLEAPWNSDYHTNINLQMNYWHAEVANLAECHLPLFDYMQKVLLESGKKTAKTHYGARGWVVHHLSDVWGFTTPADGVWGVWPMGAAWLCQHLWEHYAFHQDTAFLREQAYPLMKEAALFILDYLTPDKQGRLVTNPSHSPENRYRMGNSTEAMFTYGATMDLQIIHNLLTNCIQASDILGKDTLLRAQMQKALAKLAPLQISPRTGRLQEWIEDYAEPEPGHRHISHLFGVFPSDQITLRKNPEFAQAARNSLEFRLQHGGGHTGWSRAWIIALWARFGAGEHVHENVQELLAHSTAMNLFDLHPPGIFQIDGNCGGSAGIAESLLQSHEGEISLLPALPKAWRQGEITGLRARGGYTVSLQWRNQNLQEVTLQWDNSTFSQRERTALIRFPQSVMLESITQSGSAVSYERGESPQTIRLRLHGKRSYILRFRVANP